MAFSITRRRYVAVASAAVVAAAAVITGVILSNEDNSREPRYRGYLDRAGGEEAEEHGIEGVVGDPASESAEISQLDHLGRQRTARALRLRRRRSALLQPGQLPHADLQRQHVVRGHEPPLRRRRPELPRPRVLELARAARATSPAESPGSRSEVATSSPAAPTAACSARISTTRPTRATTAPWQPISDAILSLSTGDLEYHDGALWYATGEANTGGDLLCRLGHVPQPARGKPGRRVGPVHRRRPPRRHGAREPRHQQGAVRRREPLGVRGDHPRPVALPARRSTNAPVTGSTWTQVFMPNPAADRDISHAVQEHRQRRRHRRRRAESSSTRPGAAGTPATTGSTTATTGAVGSYTQTNPPGCARLPTTSATPSSPGAPTPRATRRCSTPWSSRRTSSPTPRRPCSMASSSPPTGTLAGPWNRIADSGKLQSSGSALQWRRRQRLPARACRPGTTTSSSPSPATPTTWARSRGGLREQGRRRVWTTPGPYWNFGFTCWNISDAKNTCPQTTHADQHSIVAAGGRVYIGNDGGVKSRPVNGTVDCLGHANDWTNHSPGLRTLQYYSVGVGADPERGGYAVSGGLQDNGGSLLRGDRKDNQGHTEMVSPFGGDGGDIIVDPEQRLPHPRRVRLPRAVDDDELRPDRRHRAAPSSTSTSRTRTRASPHRSGPSAARRTPVTTPASAGSPAATPSGRTTSGSPPRRTQAESLANHGWTKRTTLGTGGPHGRRAGRRRRPRRRATPTKDVVVAAWCGESNCNSTGFTRGVQTNFGGTWHELDMTGLPNRLPQGSTSTASPPARPPSTWCSTATTGASSRARVPHRTTSGRASSPARWVTWTNESAGTPDVPFTDVVRYGNKLVVGTDYGVLVGDDRLRPATCPAGSGSAARPARRGPSAHDGVRPAGRARRIPLRRHPRPRHLEDAIEHPIGR